MSAYKELIEFLQDGEVVEGIVFGAWGWDGYSEPMPAPVPVDVRSRLMTLEQAAQYMTGWSFGGGYGAPKCYATYIWTNQRVIWVTQYDGSTGLDCAPRNPMDCVPEMPGG